MAAGSLQVIGSIFKKLPFYDSIVNSVWYKLLRHKIALHVSARENSTFTGFLRLPTQYEALCGPVLDYVGAGNGEVLRIAIIGCSNGAEVYTVASFIKKARPNLRFAIEAFDIDRAMLEKGASGAYAHDEVHNNKRITMVFLEDTFDTQDHRHRVKQHIKSHVSFAEANVLDPGLAEITGSFDIVFAQNFIFHLKRRDAALALKNLYSVLRPRAALFIDGVDIDMRQRFSREVGLRPLDFKVEQIHNEARWAREAGWPYNYWGLEPYGAVRRDAMRRYATIFLR
ncbi:MAG: CheR family methyltransferase [Gammaproteobacteria bacterium]